MAKYKSGQTATHVPTGRKVVITNLITDEDDEYEALYEVTFDDGESVDADDSALKDVV